MLKSVCVIVGTDACSALYETAPGAGQRELEGRGMGSGSCPLWTSV